MASPDAKWCSLCDIDFIDALPRVDGGTKWTGILNNTAFVIARARQLLFDQDYLLPPLSDAKHACTEKYRSLVNVIENPDMEWRTVCYGT